MHEWGQGSKSGTLHHSIIQGDVEDFIEISIEKLQLALGGNVHDSILAAFVGVMEGGGGDEGDGNNQNILLRSDQQVCVTDQLHLFDVVVIIVLQVQVEGILLILVTELINPDILILGDEQLRLCQLLVESPSH